MSLQIFDHCVCITSCVTSARTQTTLTETALKYMPFIVASNISEQLLCMELSHVTGSQQKGQTMRLLFDLSHGFTSQC